MARNGFSLIELVTAIGIVGILAAIAIPAYSSYTRRANRIDATRTLTVDAQALERCYSQSFTYVGCTQVAANAASSQGLYTVAVTSTANSYTITATPVSTLGQAKDAACQTFTLDNTGKQYATDGSSDNTKTCWGST